MSTNTIYDVVERLSEFLRIDARQAGAEHGLQPVQLEVLHYLSICNRYSDTPMAVTEYLGQTKGTVSQTLKVLEKKELIEKIPDKEDKRITHLKVSSLGRELIKEVLPTSMFIKGCETLTIKQQDEIEAALKQLLVSLLQSNSMKSFGVCSSCRHNAKPAGNEYFCNLVKQPLSNNEIKLICREHESAESN